VIARSLKQSNILA